MARFLCGLPPPPRPEAKAGCRGRTGWRGWRPWRRSSCLQGSLMAGRHPTALSSPLCGLTGRSSGTCSGPHVARPQESLWDRTENPPTPCLCLRPTPAPSRGLRLRSHGAGRGHPRHLAFRAGFCAGAVSQAPGGAALGLSRRASSPFFFSL